VNNREGNYRFTDDNEPEHVPRDAARSKVGAEPSTKDRNKDEEPSARYESGAGGDTAPDELAREYAREQRVCCLDKNRREQVAAHDDDDGFLGCSHRLRLHVGHEITEVPDSAFRP
jgi:hypothetical protein